MNSPPLTSISPLSEKFAWFRRAYAWLGRVPGDDDLQRQQAVLMQILLLMFFIVLLLVDLLNLALGGLEAVTPAGLGISGVVLALMALAIRLLRRGYFTPAIGLVVTICLAGITVGLVQRGLPTHEAWLSAFIIPILLTGLLLKRRYLLLTTMINVVIVVGIYGLEQVRPGGPIPAPPGTVPTSATVIIFLLALSLSSLFLDQFARAFRQALRLAASQTRDLEHAHALLQQHAADLARGNAELQAEIDARHQAEATLRENEQRLFQFLEAVPLGIAVFEAEGRPYYTNRAAQRIVGREPDLQAPITQAAQLYHAYLAGTNEIYPADRSPTARALAGEAVMVEDVEIRRGDRIVPLQTWGAPIVDAAGHITYAILAMADITERKQRDAALSQSLARFTQAFRAIPNALVLTRLSDDVIIELNERWPTLTGYSREEVMGRPSDSLDLISAEDRQSINVGLQATGFTSLHDHEVMLRCKSGEQRNVLISIEVLEIDGEPIALTVTHDITERKRAEAELCLRARQQATVATLGQRALVAATLDELMSEATQLATAGLDADYCALSELTPDGEKLLLRSVYGWPAELVRQVGVRIDRTSQAGATLLARQPLILDEQHPQPEFGMSAYVLDRGAISAISVVVPGAEQPFGTLVVHSTRRRTFTDHDVYFLQSVATLLAAAIEQERSVAARAERDAAEQANLAKSEFLSRVSHELRTPLHAILGFGQLLEMTELSTLQQESVNHVQTAGQHLLALINEVLDISSIEAGRMAFSPEPVLLRDVLEESLVLIRPIADQLQIVISTPDLATATLLVIADHQRLKQVLLNLLSNAIKYNRRGGRVEIGWDAPTTASLHLTVRDTGRGIPADFLPRLFTPFERGLEQVEVEGTGLGLALSQRLMGGMEGRLGLESTDPTGSTFGLNIPLAPDQKVLPPRRTAATPMLLPITGPPQTLLLIDDNPSNLRLVERILELRPRLKILAAQQGQQGLEMARTHQPDLIFLDLQLPDLGGDMVLQYLLDDPATAAIPVVIFSADATPGQISRLRAAGATDYLTKPFRVQAFLSLIDRVLQKSDVLAQ